MSGQPEMPCKTSLGEKGFVWCDLTDDDASDPLGKWRQTGDLWNRDRHDSAGQVGGVGSNDNAGGKQLKERDSGDDDVGHQDGADRFADVFKGEHASGHAEDVDADVGIDDIDDGPFFIQQLQQS